MEWDRILKKYLAKKVQAACDIIAWLPLDFAAIAVGIQYLPYLRMAKILRSVHTFKYFARLEDYIVKRRWGISAPARRMIKIFTILIMAVHFVACIWLFISYQTGISGDATCTWTYKDTQGPFFEHYTDPVIAWLRSMYWVIVGTSTVGYGDIVPCNTIETLFATCVILIGGLLYPAVVGGLAALMENVSTRWKTYSWSPSLPPSLSLSPPPSL